MTDQLYPWQVIVAAFLLLLPVFMAAFAPRWTREALRSLRTVSLAMLAACLIVPYLLILTTVGAGTIVRWWSLVYFAGPPAVVLLLARARKVDPEQRGTWRDLLVLLLLGLAVDLRWLDSAWPAHLRVFDKVLLLDIGIFGFLGARRLNGVGFDLRLRGHDLLVGAREFLLYAPGAVALGLWLGFLHWHPGWPRPGSILLTIVFTFLLIAVPEELFFRGWIQNLLERRLGSRGALLVTSGLFGLSHFNKRTTAFNWRYVLLASLAGVFYGRAWRQERRVAAAAVTHTLVDTLWSLLLQ